MSSDGESTPQHPTRRRFYYALPALILGLFIVPSAAASVLIWALHDVHFPSPTEVTSQRVIVLQTADGRQLPRNGLYRLGPVPAQDMPADVTNAVLSIEDRRFYQHGAVDPWSMLRALKQNVQAGGVVAGGSTITQQLAKNLFLGPQRTYRRKLQEAAIAIWLERHLNKDEILTSYLNNVYLGSGATGFPAAAKVYFGKNIADLNLPEAAMLAGMINAPGQDDPIHNLNAARSRAATVLDAMVSNGKLNQETALVAKLHPATPNSEEISSPSTGWFADWIYDKAAAATPPFAGAVSLRTTLNPQLQELASNAVNSTLATYGSDDHATQAALVVMRPDGAVVAMVGGRNYAESQYNRAIQAQRQPGSAFKLFDYYAALRRGFSPEDEIVDEPVDVHGWEPENSGRRYHGSVTLATAFANSLNAATVRLSQQVGLDQIIAAARDLGLRAPLQKNPSLVLGTADVSLLDLTSAYATVRAGAAPVEPWGIASLRTQNDQDDLPVGRGDEPQHSLGPYEDQLIDLLQGVVQHGTGREAALHGFAAGKTGTSQDYRDAWFIGFNDSLVAGVWVGNDDHSPMNHVVGGSLPAMIWKRFMEKAGTIKTTPTDAPQASNAPQASKDAPQSSNAPQASKDAPQAPKDTSQASKDTSQASNESSDQSSSTPATSTASSHCNVSVCEKHYDSFRASDCTYQPYSGARQYCDR